MNQFAYFKSISCNLINDSKSDIIELPRVKNKKALPEGKCFFNGINSGKFTIVI